LDRRRKAGLTFFPAAILHRIRRTTRNAHRHHFLQFSKELEQSITRV
jgi:hypothetical protein